MFALPLLWLAQLLVPAKFGSRQGSKITLATNEECLLSGAQCPTKSSFDDFLSHRQAEARAVVNAATAATQQNLKWRNSKQQRNPQAQRLSELLKVIQGHNVGKFSASASCETDIKLQVAKARIIKKHVNHEFEKWFSNRAIKHSMLQKQSRKYKLSWVFAIHPCLSFFYKHGVYTTPGKYPSALAILRHLLYHFSIGFEHAYVIAFCKPEDLTRFTEPPAGALRRLASIGYISWIPLALPVSVPPGLQGAFDHTNFNPEGFFAKVVQSQALAVVFTTHMQRETQWLAVIDVDELLHLSQPRLSAGGSILDELQRTVASDALVPAVCLPVSVWFARGVGGTDGGTGTGGDEVNGERNGEGDDVLSAAKLIQYVSRAEQCAVLSPYSVPPTEAEYRAQGKHVDLYRYADRYYESQRQAACFKTIYRTEAVAGLNCTNNMHTCDDFLPGFAKKPQVCAVGNCKFGTAKAITSIFIAHFQRNAQVYDECRRKGLIVKSGSGTQLARQLQT